MESACVCWNFPIPLQWTDVLLALQCPNVPQKTPISSSLANPNMCCSHSSNLLYPDDVGGTYVPGFWSWKGLVSTVLTLMIAMLEVGIKL